jgi:aminopeptidase N
MKRIFCIIIFSLIISGIFAQDKYLRNSKIDIIHYDFSIILNDSTNRITATASIVAKNLKSVQPVNFDLKGVNPEGKGMKVSEVSLNGIPASWKHKADKLEIIVDRKADKADTLIFKINYSGIPADGLIISKNKYGNRTFFADHWPDRAHNYLPCIDHPYDKAGVDFIITAPSRYSVVASGHLLECSPLASGMTLTHWTESVPLATKVMTFGAASFATRYAGDVNGVPVWSWVYPENSKAGFVDYSVALKPMAFYSRIIGKYPFEKLANVQSKTIYGGLENAGTIFYSENSVTGLGRAEGLIAHEIAHQWFGDCVTEADWHHVWLSEGFATYLTSLYFESFQGRSRLETDMSSARTRVLKYYEKKPAPVIDTTITNLMDLLSANSYQKGAWVLHMLRYEIGNENFIKGLQLFYKRFYNSNALTGDFRNVMEEVSGRNLEQFFRQWIYTAGQPQLKISQQAGTKKGSVDVKIEQTQDYIFQFTLELLIKDGSGEKNEKVSIRDKTTKLQVKASGQIEIIPDPHVNLLFKAE